MECLYSDEKINILDFFYLIKLDKPINKIKIGEILNLNIEKLKDYELDLTNYFNVKLTYNEELDRYIVIDDGDLKFENIGDIFSSEDITNTLYILNSQKVIPTSKHYILTEKLISMLREESREKVRKVLNFKYPFKNILDYDIKTFVIINHAINKNKIIEFYYINESEVIKKYKINPHSFIFEDNLYYLIGETSNKIDHFRIDNIRNIKQLNEEANNINDYDIINYLNRTWYMYKGDEIKVTLKISKNLFDEVYKINKEGQLLEINEDLDYFIYQFIANGEEGILKWIIKHFEDIEIIEPLILKENLIKKLKRVITLYDKK